MGMEELLRKKIRESLSMKDVSEPWQPWQPWHVVAERNTCDRR